MDFVQRWSSRTEIPAKRLVRWIGIAGSKFYEWKGRYGRVNEHNGWIPRDFWLMNWEREAIIEFFLTHPDEGYRRLAFLMLDADVVAVSPSTVYRVLSAEGLLRKWKLSSSSKGEGFKHPSRPHEHWHVDVSYLNLRGTFYYLLSVLDGYSRYIVHWEIRQSMTEADVEIILQRALECFPAARPRVISDNGPQFIARDLREFIRLKGMDHVRISPYYPQSNGKIERWHQSLKRECIRPRCPVSLEDAREVVTGFVEHYNTRRLHSAIGYITPLDKLMGRAEEIFAARDRKLEAARERRKVLRQTGERNRKPDSSKSPVPGYQGAAGGLELYSPAAPC